MSVRSNWNLRTGQRAGYRVVSSLGGMCALLALLVVGCQPPAAEFSNREGTRDLIPAARKPVEEVLQENYGSPDRLVAWLKLPVEYGGYEGQAVATEAEGPLSSFPVKFAAPPETVSGNPELFWKTGTYNQKTVSVADYDLQQKAITIHGRFPEPPGGGDTFLFDAGHVLKRGQQVYRRHCQHCHGVTGDGNGPTAEYLDPHPRDYRLGIFKFTSTTQTDKARRADLKRTIRRGIPGTYMPSFMLMDDEDLDAVVEYIRWLAMRGEHEKRMVDALSGDYSQDAVQERLEQGETKEAIGEQLGEYLKNYFPEEVAVTADIIAGAWQRAEKESSMITPSISRVPNTVESRRKGRELFLSKKAKCATCHGPLGQGNGPQTESVQTIPGTNEKYPKPGLYDEWGDPIDPRDLTRGIYRGGRRPIDIFRRIYVGIKGTPMPAFGGTTLTDEEIWHLVNYVKSLPFEDQRPSAAKPAPELALQSDSSQRQDGSN